MTAIQTAKEMWETINGGEAPAEFLTMVEVYMKHKCVNGPLPFTESDFAALAVDYFVLTAVTTKAKGKKGQEQNG